MTMVLDHIGVAVRSIDAGLSLWVHMLGYRQVTEPVDQPPQRVRVVFLEKLGSPAIKLVEPTDSTSKVFPLARRGGGVHHLCYCSDDLDADLADLVDKGARLLVAPEAGRAFGGGRIAFVHVGQGVTVELIETEEKTSRIGSPS